MPVKPTIEDWQAKIDTLNKEAWAIRVSNSVQAFSLSGEAVALARKAGYKKGMAEGLRTFGFAHIRQSKYKEAKRLLDEALLLFEELGDERGKSDVFEYYGIICRSCGNFDASLENLYNSLDLRVRTGYREGVSLSLYHLGVTYKYLGNYEQALHHLLQSLDVAGEVRYWVAESYALNLIGQVYFETADFQQALHYYRQSLQIRKSSGDQWGEAGCLDNIGYTFYKLGETEKAIRHCTESLLICRSTGDKKGQANALFHLGEFYLQNGETETALSTTGESLQIRREIDDKKGQAEVLLLLAAIAAAQRAAHKLVATHLTEALQLANETKARDLLANVHFHFYQYHKQRGAYQLALESFEAYNRLEKELHKDALAEKVINLQITNRIEQAKKEAESYRLRNDELAVLNAELKKQKEETEQQKIIAETSLQQLKETQAQLVQKEKMASLGELTAGIAHEIQNPLNFVNNFSETNRELIAELKQELEKCNVDEAKAIADDIEANEKKIIHHGKRADSIVKNMLQHTRSSTGEKQLTDINALVDEYLRLAYHGFRSKHKNFSPALKTDFDTRIGKINLVPQDIGRVLLNLFTNAFYAVNEKEQQESGTFAPTVYVSTERNSKLVTITVRDNGTGISPNVTEKVFQPFFTTKPAGEGTGLGLSLSYDIVTKGHGGTISVQSSKGKGAEFLVKLPA